MPDIILHHDPLWPFSETARLALGLKPLEIRQEKSRENKIYPRSWVPYSTQPGIGY